MIIDQGIAQLVLNRPEKHNAFDEKVIAQFTQNLENVAKEKSIRVLQISARGKNFCAGADLHWMERMAAYDQAENLKDAGALGQLMHRLYSMPQPTIGMVQGAAYGGGVGLASCCDIVLATPDAKFCLSEVKLGLIPAVISPYVINALGPKRAQRLFLTAEIFSAEQARDWGLVDYIHPQDRLKEEADALSELLRKNGPMAIEKSKELVRNIANRPIDQNLIAETARYIADQRASPEAKSGLKAFFSKTKPEWIF